MLPDPINTSVLFGFPMQGFALIAMAMTKQQNIAVKRA
jgi:hypothetical protein